jgi:hypothetical protein
MAYLPGDLTEQNISEFRGSTPRLGDYGTPITNALYSQNVAYNPGQVSKRLGHSVAFTIASDGAALNLVNWFFYFSSSPVIICLYYSSTVGVKGRQLAPTPGFTSALIPVTGAAGASIVPTGQRLYATFYDSTGRVASAGDVGSVYGWNLGVDPLFAAPLASTVIASETGAGNVTAGVHRVGFLATTRNGFTTSLSPVDSLSRRFDPVSFTSTGSQNLSIQISGALPTYMVGGSVQMVMTTTENLNRWYTVPGATAAAANPVTLTADIDDDDLAATGTDVTDQLNLLTCSSQTAPFGAPFNPSAIFSYSNRMGYVTIDLAGVPVVYMSNQNDYQHITADQNAIYLEAQDKPVQGISIGGVCYIGSPFCFYSCTDNNDVPATWISPQKVFGSVGILSPTCVSVDPSQTKALIAAQQGLYLFRGGVFPELPISYNQSPDWNRIDWTKPTEVHVVEDQTKKKFIVIAPLVADAAAEEGIQSAATYEMSWDYTEGETPATVKYSINPYSSYNPRSLAMIMNPSNFILEAWTGPADNGPVIRENTGEEAQPYRDVDMSGTAAPIEAIYETALVPGEDGSATATVHNFAGAHFRVIGEGGLDIRCDGVDNVRSVVPLRSPLPMGLTPGVEELVKWSLISEQASIVFGNDVVDEWFTVSLVRAYYNDAMPTR